MFIIRAIEKGGDYTFIDFSNNGEPIWDDIYCNFETIKEVEKYAEKVRLAFSNKRGYLFNSNIRAESIEIVKISFEQIKKVI